MQNLFFWDSGSVPIFCWKNPGGSIRKNGKLMDYVCFETYIRLYPFWQKRENHVLNTMNQTVELHE